MIGKFTEWLNENKVLDEANFAVNPNKTNEYDHKSTTYFEMTYLEKIKQTLLAGQPVFINVPKNVTKNEVTTEDYDYLTIKDFYSKKLQNASTYQEFCKSVNPSKLRVHGLTIDNFVNHIWKGSFSNRGNSSSLGGIFEKLLVKAFQDYQNGEVVEEKYRKAIEKIIKLIGVNPKKFAMWNVADNGNNRSKRLNNLYVNLENVKDVSQLDFDSEEHDIGKVVTDVTITSYPNENNKFYLSLKHGNTNEIVNFGAAKIRLALQDCYDDYVANGEKKLNPSQFLKNYCKIFNLDLNKLLASYDFVSNNKQPKLETFKKLCNSKYPSKGVISAQLSKLIAYCIGYGYIYVHDLGKEIEVIDLRTNEDLAKLIKKYSGNYDVKYACDTGAKTVFNFNLCSEKDKKDIFIPQSRFELRPNSGAEINLFSLKLNINGEEIGNG
jgi:hypothetical protein